MLSYRHAFHAGNHADVLKHLIEILLLDHLNQKDKPWWYIDTHAGAGAYALDEGYATQNAEFTSGIARLWSEPNLPAPLARYVALVRQFNEGDTLRRYPGSPWFAEQIARRDDRLRLFELHPTDYDILAGNFAAQHKTVQIQKADGFAGLKAVLPPAPRRGLTLIDPPYEDKQDYQRVITALQNSLKRFATGTYAIWFPRLTRLESRELPRQLREVHSKWLLATLDVTTPSPDGFGMYGSGMFILNPPWTLADHLAECVPTLARLLGQEQPAQLLIEHSPL